MRFDVAFLLIAAAITMAGPASAQEQGPESGWYGYQTLATDAAALAAGAIAWSHAGEIHADRLDSPAMLWGTIAAAAWFAGAPLVHAAHGRIEATQSSVALRFGLPALAALLGTALYGAGWAGCAGCVYAIPPLAGIALLTPIVADAAVLSRQESPPRVPRLPPGFVALGSLHGPAFAVVWRFGP